MESVKYNEHFLNNMSKYNITLIVAPESDIKA
jgi:hypothetical protein